MLVLVHGVPETAVIWDRLRDRLDRESVALPLPGFGCARPADFAADKDAYVEWLLAELDALDGPVDLVGHDWGAGLTYRVAMSHPDRLHAWAADVGNILHPAYVWHDLARVWQTPGEGEALFEDQLGRDPSEVARVFATLGVPEREALAMASAADPVMAGCILDLYRSAVPNVHAHWGPLRPTTGAPGLVLLPTLDPFGDEGQSREVAGALGAAHRRLEGAGHFWPAEAPDLAADVLTSFFASLA